MDFSICKKSLFIPPLNEQHRIVQKIEELFSELDKGIESLKTAREQLKVYRQALLKHAFEGKLTEQWRAAQGSASVGRGQESETTKNNADKLETADELLARIQQEREDCYQQQLDEWEVAVEQWENKGSEGKKPTKPRIFQSPDELTPDDLSKLPNLPSEWRWFKVGHVFGVFVGSTPSRKNNNYWGDDIAWLVVAK